MLSNWACIPACTHAHTHTLVYEYPHSMDLSLRSCCSGLICHANCCLGVPLQGESSALEELSFASWSLQESTSFPLPREKLWNSQHVFLHSLLETTVLHTVLLHPIWMEIERQKQLHKCSRSLCSPLFFFFAAPCYYACMGGLREGECICAIAVGCSGGGLYATLFSKLPNISALG